MPVIGPGEITHGAVKGAVREIENQLIDIKNEIKSANKIKTNSNIEGTLLICSRDKMVWWKKQEDASIYRLRLFIENHEIDVIEVERSKAYHTFTDLVGTGYVVKLEVEDRSGNVTKSIEITI